MLTNKIYKNIDYIFLILPLAFVTGPFITDMAIIFLGLWYLLFFFDSFKNDIKHNQFIKFFILFVLLNIVISLFAKYPMVSIKSSLPYFRFIIFVLALSFLIYSKVGLLIKFFYILSFVIIFLTLDGIYQFIFDKKNIFGMVADSKNRISSLFGDEYVLGSFVSKTSPLLLIIYTFLKKELNVRFLILTLICSLIVTMISGERSAFLMLIIFNTISLFFILKIGFIKRVLFFICMSLIILPFIIIDKNLNQRFINHTKQQIFSTLKKEKNEETVDRHIYNQHSRHIQVAYKMFQDRPLGLGNKMFRFVCLENEKYFKNDGRCSTHPHNITLLIAVENGIIGLIFYLVFLAYFVTKLFKSNEEHIKLTVLLILILFNPILPSGNLFNNWFAALLFVPISFYYYFVFRR